MKSIKPSIFLVFLFLSLTARSQFYHDSLQVTGVQVLPSVSQGINFFVRYYRDSVTYDSTNGADEYYTVEKRIVGLGGTTSKFKLRVNDKRVYLSGTVYFNKVLKDQIIYDYNLNIGDTLTVKLNADTLLDMHFRLDSARMMMFKDGVKRIMYFYTRWQGNNTFNEPFFSTEGLGSSLGVVYFRTEGAPVMEEQLISVCVPSKLIYGNDDCVVGTYRIIPFCEEDSITSEVAKARRTNVNNVSAASALNVYPNPATQTLTLNANTDGRLNIMNMAGGVCHKQAFEQGLQTIDISTLQTGMYLVSIETDIGTIFKKITIFNQ